MVIFHGYVSLPEGIRCSKHIPITIFMGEMQIVLAMSSCLLLKTKFLYGENDVMFLLLPIGSMYGIHANIGGILMVNVTIYSIHGSYGLWMARAQSLLTISTISVCFVCIVYTKTNWWLTYPFETYQSDWIILPTILGKIKLMFQTTNQKIVCFFCWVFLGRLVKCTCSVFFHPNFVGKIPFFLMVKALPILDTLQQRNLLLLRWYIS